MPINPNEAPKGYKAVEASTCVYCYGCAFRSGSGTGCQLWLQCNRWFRRDACSVVFVKSISKYPTNVKVS